MAKSHINNRFREFFEELYTSRVNYSDSDLSSFLNSIPFPALTEEVREGLEADITLEEVQNCCGGTERGESPRGGWSSIRVLHHFFGTPDP